jgi:G3E family GTPase
LQCEVSSFEHRNDLVAAIEYIIENTQVSNIVVETNGIADPA